MAKKKERANPFYILLVAAGIAFCVTACAYGMMAFRADRRGRAPEAAFQASKLLTFLEDHGGTLLAGEVAVLAVATLAAMATDRLWSRSESRAAARGDSKILTAASTQEASRGDAT